MRRRLIAFVSLVSLVSVMSVGAGAAAASGARHARYGVASSAFVVTNAGDQPDLTPGNGICSITGGGCTLRAALQESNALAGPDNITFGVGFGAVTIAPASALPIISDTVTIDGTTQPGFEGLPIVELNGTSAGFSANGLQVQANNAVIKGLVINRFGSDGITVSAGSGSTFQDNLIGTDRTGTVDLGNGKAGIRLGTPSQTVGGTGFIGPMDGAGNLISGNGGGGIVIGSVSGSNTIQGNLIGTNLAGTAALGNTGVGIAITTAPNNTIGGAQGNVIAGNTQDGINISGGSGNVVSGNWIGTDVSITAPIGNGGDGVELTGNTSGNVVGGNRNEISFNAGAGIRVSSGVNNDLDTNDITSNGQLGIDLGPTGVTPNDSDDVDAGANNLQNFPVLVLQATAVDHVTLQVNVDATAGKVFDINFFSSPSCDASGNGEGARSIFGFGGVGTNASGNVQFSHDFDFDTFPSGSAITATASQRSGNPAVSNTSEFSACFIVPFAHTYTVNDTGDAGDATVGDAKCRTAGGVCTLRAAIQEANAASDWDRIAFGIGTGAQTILPATALAAISQPVTVDGASQPGFVSDPLIELVGTNAKANGLTISGTNVTIRSLAINRFSADGILVQASASLATIQGCSIGTDRAGVTDLGNNLNGIEVFGANSLIGGASPALRNVLSGNARSGIAFESGASSNGVLGNLIGLNKTGTGDLGNSGDGIFLAAGSFGTNIGRSTFGSSPSTGNVISGNDGNGIESAGGGGALIWGNLIGTNLAGTSSVGNGESGVRVAGAGNAIQVGRGFPGAGNTISGNGGDGISVIGAQFKGVSIAGNRIGTTANGANDAGNARSGIFVSNTPGVTIGGTTPRSWNVISGNDGNGVTLTGSSAAGAALFGSLIGLNAAGTAALPNTGDGVFVQVPGVTIGGTDLGARNVISGNGHSGVALASATASGAAVVRNLIGTDASGSVDLGNDDDGVVVTGASNVTIGGVDPGDGNVISGNNGDGVQISGPGTTGDTVAGDLIGTDPTAALDLGNAGAGVRIAGAPANTVGGSQPGSGNVIDGNDGPGVSVTGGGASGNTVAGNTIGIRTAGVVFPVALPNAGDGVFVSGAPGTSIGGQPGQGGNTIGGNGGHGVEVTAGASGTQITGNLIGTDGFRAVANALDGVFVGGSPSTAIGSTSGRNVISGNGENGVEITGAGSTSVTVQGNAIGTQASGSGFVRNGQNGVLVSGTPGVTIGGAAGGVGNVIGGNTLDGIAIVGPGAGGGTIQGNVIGVSPGPPSQGSQNLQNGVRIQNASLTLIGGLMPGASNVIRFNLGDGVLVASGARNRIQANAIDRNGEQGIDLGPDDGVTPNDNLDGDTGANTLQNFPVLTAAVTGGGALTLTGSLNSIPSTVFTMDVYSSPACDASGNGQGATYVGTVTLPATDANGNSSFTNLDLPASVPPNQSITATASTANGNTSEFSSCRTAAEAFANLGVTTSDSPDPVTVNNTLTYTVTVTNAGPNRSLGTTLTHTLGRRLSLTSVTTSAGTCQGVQRRVTCDLGILAPGAVVTVTIVTQAVSAGTITNVATVAGDITDQTPVNNQASATTQINN